MKNNLNLAPLKAPKPGPTWKSFIFFALVLLDLISLKYPFMGRFGMDLWLFSFLLLFLFWSQCFWQIIKQFLNKKALLTGVSLLILFLVIGANLGNFKNVSGETTQQINCFLNQIKEAKDKGFKKTCFLGYPARQYLLPALPSMIFGRSVLTLNLGGSLYFFLGVIIFAAGILRYFGEQKGDLINGFLLSSFWHLYSFNHFMFFFEQSIYPFSLGLVMVGIFLHFLKDYQNGPLSLFGILLLYLIYSYPPSLALFFLGIFALFYLFFKTKLSFDQKIVILFYILFSLLSLSLSFKFRKDLNIFSQEREASKLVQDLFFGFKHLLFQSEGKPFVSPLYNFIFITFTLLFLSGLFGAKFFLLSIWILGVIVSSIIARGYAYYGVDFRLQRGIIIFPVFLAMLAKILAKLEENKQAKKALLVIILILSTSGLIFTRAYLNTKEEAKHVQLIYWLKARKSFNQDLENLYFIGEAYQDYINLNDRLEYFIPSLKSSQLSANLLESCRLKKKIKGLLVIKKSHSCRRRWLENSIYVEGFSYLGSFLDLEVFYYI